MTEEARIDDQLAAANGKRANESRVRRNSPSMKTDVTIPVDARGNTVSNAVLLGAAVVIALLGVMSGAAWAFSYYAEREARVTQDKMEHYELLMVQKGVIKPEEVH